MLRNKGYLDIDDALRYRNVKTDVRK